MSQPEVALPLRRAEEEVAALQLSVEHPGDSVEILRAALTGERDPDANLYSFS